MSQDAEHEFYDRAYEHLRVANEQLTDVSRGEVSASMLYACARFNAWVSASNRESAKDLKGAYGETNSCCVSRPFPSTAAKSAASRERPRGRCPAGMSPER